MKKRKICVSRVLKMTSLFFLSCAMCAQAETVSSQSIRITLNKNNVRLENILNDIESQTNLLFIYNKNVNVNRKVSVNAQNTSLQEVLQNLFDNNVSFKIEGSYIVLSPAGATGSPQQATHTVKGVVEDALGPIAGANVVEKGTTNGTITDMDGNFTLEGVKNGDVIQISFIGYSTMEITYTGQPVGVIKLAEDTQKLDEVVVTALGMKRSEKSLGYAMQELKGDALLDSRESNIANALSGKVSGLQVVRSSGSVGGSSKIVLRGANSLTGSNQPLVVVDGTPMDNFTGGVDDAWGNSGTDMGNGLSDINPEDIESMSVLKGASAAALYGSRAGNGVILITTKSGKKNDGLGINVNFGVTADTPFMLPELQSSFGQGSVGAYNDQTNLSWGPRIEGQTITTYDGRQVPMAAYDNIGAFFGTGTSFNEGVSFQQDVNGTSMFFSFNRQDDSGVTPEQSLNKTNLTLRATSFLDEAKKWKVDAKVNYVNQNAHNRPIIGINPSNAFSTVYNLPRSLNVLDFENCVDDQGKMVWYDKSNSPQENPYWVTQYRQNDDTRNRILGNASLKYAPTDWFDIELRGGTDYYTTTTTQKLYSGGNTKPEGSYSEGSETFYENNFSFLATARKDDLISKLGGFVTFGGNIMQQKRTKMNASAGTLLVPDLFDVNNGVDKPSITSSLTQRKMNSLYGSLQLNWDGWLFLDVTARNDWSSTMSKENRSYFYPSVSLSAVISDMVQKNGGSMPDWFSFAKVRASFAEVGNDLDPYQLYNVYTISKDANGNSMASAGSTLFDSSVKSELIKSWEVGADLRFFNNRFGIDAAWYKTNATNQLLNIPMDAFSGYESRKVNAGNIQNQGFELSLNGAIMQTASGFNWDAQAHFSLNRSKILELTEGVTVYDIKTVDVLQIAATEGGKYGDIYGQKFVRHNGQVVVGEDGLPLITTDKELIGNQNPDWMLGLTNNFSYKGFDLSFLIDFRIGGEIYSATTSSLHKNGNAAGTVVNGDRADFVVPNSIMKKGDEYVKNDVAVTPQRYWERIASSGNYGLPEVFTYDATNIRLRNITLGYTFNKNLLKKTPFQKLRLSATCNNVWMIVSHLPGIDPESVAATNTNAVGFENGGAPTNRSYTFNLTVGF